MKISFPHREIETEQSQINSSKFCKAELYRSVTHVSVIHAISRHCVLRYFLLAYAQSTYDYLRIRLRSFVSSILSYFSLKP